jgi:myo-inositol-1(or 4)-monophosphatase
MRMGRIFMENIKTYLNIAKEAAKTAGKYIFQEQNKNVKLIRSEDGLNYYTKIDINSQELIYNLISSKFPDHQITCEERTSRTTGSNESEYIWYVDPLDGTWNYINGGEWYSVSIALQKGDSIILGCVYQPSKNKMFTALKSTKKAFCGNQILNPSKSKFPGEWIITFGSPSKYKDTIPQHFEKNLLREYDSGDSKRPLKIWRFMPGRGAMALELCYLASGMINAIVRFKQKPWDVAAGMLIANEAGAKITNFSGAQWQDEIKRFNYNYCGDFIGVSNPEVFDIFIKLLNHGIIE